MSRMGEKARGRPRHPDVLTPAEWRVVDGVRHGMTNRQIARGRGTSLDAVKSHVENARAKLGLESRAELRFWCGAPAGSAMSRGGTDMTASQLQLGSIGQIARHVADVKRAEAWYRDVLGLKHLYSFGNLAFFDCGGTRLFLTAPEPGASAGNSVLYFQVDEIGSAYETLRTRGVTFLGAPHMIHRHEDGTEEWMAFFNDPDGSPLALMAQARPLA